MLELKNVTKTYRADLVETYALNDVSLVVDEGEFFELLGFLFGLSDMERLVRVDAIAISSTQDDEGGTILSASIEMRLFTLADLIPILDELEDVQQGEEPPGDTGGDAEALGGGS